MLILTFAALILAMGIIFADGLGHILASLGRLALGRRSGIRWVKVISGLSSAVLVWFAWISDSRNDLKVFSEFEWAAFGALAVLLATIAIKVVRTWQKSSDGFRPFAWASTMVSLFTMPIIAAFVASAFGHARLEESMTLNDLVNPDPVVAAFFKEVPPSNCAAAVQNFEYGLEPIFQYGEKLNEFDAWEQLVLFWVDQTAKGMLLDIPEVFDCRFSSLEHDPDRPGLSGMVGGYRIMVSLIFITLVVWPFASRKRA